MPIGPNCPSFPVLERALRDRFSSLVDGMARFKCTMTRGESKRLGRKHSKQYLLPFQSEAEKAAATKAKKDSR